MKTFDEPKGDSMTQTIIPGTLIPGYNLKESDQQNFYSRTIQMRTFSIERKQPEHSEWSLGV